MYRARVVKEACIGALQSSETMLIFELEVIMPQECIAFVRDANVTGQSLRLSALAGLVIAAAGWVLAVFGLLGDDVLDAVSGPLVTMAAFYGLTVLSFAALPSSRRNDLAAVLAVVGLLIPLARQAVDGHRHIYEAAWAAAGVVAVYLPSHLEAMRKTMRETPFAPAFQGPVKTRRAAAPSLLGLPAPLFAAWGLGLAIVIFTLGPQAWRPHLADAATERFGAYFVAAFAFAIAYPKRRGLIAGAAVVAAILLELAQYTAPGRDPGVPDAIAKAIGGLAGVSVAAALSLAWKHAKSFRVREVRQGT